MAAKTIKVKLPNKVDVIIAGAGYVGLCCAVSIAASAPHLKVAIVDPAPDEAVSNDERASAIAAAASKMLDQLGIWAELEANAQSINEMIVTDSKLSDITRPVFLTFSQGGKPEGGEDGTGPFAHMLENRFLILSLRKHAEKLGIFRIVEDGVSGFETNTGETVVTLTSARTIRTNLLIACDGVRSRLRDMAGIKTVQWPYDQKGIVCTVNHERPHEGRAEEHFLPAGPFAILPLTGNRSSLVWTESSRDTERLLKADPLMFETELEQRFGYKLGEISLASKVQAFPLGLKLARDYVAPRFALAGDAAHGIHPIAGQGLNLGFKDAAALAETIVEADRLGMDIGSLNVLERYQQWRRFDTVRMGVVTDVLNRLFSNDNDLLRAARNVGLGIVDRLPGLKAHFIDQAAGNDNGLPRLLRGEPI